MRNKITYTLIVIVLIITGSWYYSNKEKTTVAKPVASQTDKHLTNQQDVITSEKKNQSPNVNKPIPIPQEITIELSQQKFSQEPFIEIMLVKMKQNLCKRYLSNSDRSFVATKKQQKLFVEFQDNCQILESQYPHVFESDMNKKVQFMVMTMLSESKYVGLLQKGLGYKFMSAEQKQQFSKEIIYTILTSKNGLLISMLPGFFKSPDSPIFMKQLSDTLGTKNLLYTQLISEQAVTLFSCQFSEAQSCSATSLYMYQQCQFDDSACGLDVQAWFERNHSPAHNRDIAKLVYFFNSKKL